MQKDDIFNLNSAYNQVISEGTVDLGPQGDSQQGDCRHAGPAGRAFRQPGKRFVGAREELIHSEFTI